MSNLLIKIALNTILGLGLIFLWSRFVNLEEIWQILQKVEIQYILVFFLFFFFSGMVRSLRFKILLSKYQLPWKSLAMLHFLSQFLSLLIPIRAGEIAKSVFLTHQYKLPLSKTIIWVLVDRMLDFLMTLLVIGILLLLLPTNLPEHSIKIVFGLFLLMLVITVVFVKNEHLLKKFTIFLSNYLVFKSIRKPFVSLIHTVIEGAMILRCPLPILLSTIFLSLMGIISDSMIWFFLFRSVDFQISFPKSMLGDGLTALGYLIPAAPGYIGSVEAGALAVFSGVLGFDRNLVSAAAILMHLLTLLTSMIFGVTSLYFLKFNLNLVWKKLKREESKE